MKDHPIQGLMTTAMDSISGMVDVNTIVGEPVQGADGTIIIPISKVTFGFAAGGGEYGNNTEGRKKYESDDNSDNSSVSKFPFAGGSGAGVTIYPVGFLVVGTDHVRLLPVETNAAVDKILEIIPDFLDKIGDAWGGHLRRRRERGRSKIDADD